MDGERRNLEVLSGAIDRISLFDRLVSDLRYVSFRVPGKRGPISQRKEDYQRASQIIKDNPAPLTKSGSQVSKKDLGLLGKIAEQRFYKGGPEIERLRVIFRAYWSHYLGIFQQAY